MNLNRKATVDSEGNIILPGASVEPAEQAHVEMTMEEGVWYSPAPDQKNTLMWNEPEEMAEEVMDYQEVAEEVAPAISTREVPAWTVVEETTEQVRTDVVRQFKSLTSDVMQESVRQYATSFVSGRQYGREGLRSLSRGAKRLMEFLRQPVWIPGKRSEPKQYSRGALFFFDTLRFGGTFASLFILLFVTLNAQSFWAIAQSYVDPLAEVTGAKTSSDELGKDVANKLKKIPSLAVAGQNDGGMLAFLPPVGPPDDRLIIPKLDLNVPIVVPTNESLLKEDWKGLEEDIQESLQDGVVHYPGTARPGQAGNFFVTGHSSYFPWAPGDYKSVFARLHNLNVGDEYWIFYNGDRYRYVIQDKKEIKPSDVSVLDQPISKRIGTLMTCTPVGTTLRRLILTAQEVDPVTGLALEVGEHRHESELPKTRMEMLPI